MFISDEMLKELKNGLDYIGTIDKEKNPYSSFLKLDHHKIRLQLEIKDSIIKTARFKAQSCPIILVTLNRACSLIEGKHIRDALEVKNYDLIKLFGMEKAEKEKKKICAEQSIRICINEYINRENQ